MKQTRTLIVGLMFLVATPVLSSAGWLEASRTGTATPARHTTVFETGRSERDVHREVRRHDERRVAKRHAEERRHRDAWRHREYAGRPHEREIHRHVAPRVVYRSVPVRPAPIGRPVLVAPLIPLPLPNSLVLHFSF